MGESVKNLAESRDLTRRAKSLKLYDIIFGVKITGDQPQFWHFNRVCATWSLNKLQNWRNTHEEPSFEDLYDQDGNDDKRRE